MGQPETRPHDRPRRPAHAERGRHRQPRPAQRPRPRKRRPSGMARPHGPVARMAGQQHRYVTLRPAPPVHRALRRRHPGTRLHIHRGQTQPDGHRPHMREKSARRHTMDSRHRARRHQNHRGRPRFLPHQRALRNPGHLRHVRTRGRHHLPARRDGHAHRDPHPQPRQPARRDHPHQTLHLRQGPRLDPPHHRRHPGRHTPLRMGQRRRHDRR